MIETRENVKTLMSISGSGKDSIIDMLLPIIENEIHEYTKNNFISNISEICNTGMGISFDVSNNQISDNNNDFEDFQAGMTIKVFNSKLNDGVYTIESVEDGALTLNSSYGILNFDESAGNGISIYKVTYPNSLKLTFAQMVKFDLDNKFNIASESIDDYSISFINQNFQYPIHIVKALSKYCKVFKEVL